MIPTDLRGILQYVPRFREKTFIIGIDGAIVEDENFANILLDVAVLRSLNVRVVLVHGASAQIRALAAEKRVTASNLDGTGVTDEGTLKLALTAANRLTHEILEGLCTNDLRAASTNAIIAHPVGILHGVDQLFTGKVERVDVASAAESLLEHFHEASVVLGELHEAAGRHPELDTRRLALAMQHLARAITALQFQDMSAQLIYHLLQRIHRCADRLARDAMGDDDAPAVVEEPPQRPNPVTQDEMDAGSVELF